MYVFAAYVLFHVHVQNVSWVGLLWVSMPQDVIDKSHEQFIYITHIHVFRKPSKSDIHRCPYYISQDKLPVP